MIVFSIGLATIFNLAAALDESTTSGTNIRGTSSAAVNILKQKQQHQRNLQKQSCYNEGQGCNSKKICCEQIPALSCINNVCGTIVATPPPTLPPTLNPTEASTNVPTSSPITPAPTPTSTGSPTPEQPSGTNIIQNSGFENGLTTDWYSFGSSSISTVTSPVQSGTYAALVTNRQENWNGIAQQIANKIIVGGSYFVSAYVRLSSAGHPVKITVKEGTSTYVIVAQANIDTANEWVKLSGLYAAASDPDLQMYVEGPPAGVDIYVDSFYMVLVNAPNLVQNSGFEDGTTDNWVPYASSATISVVTDGVQSGSYSAFVSSRTATYSGISQEMGGVMTPGETYSVSAYVKLPSAGYTTKITANENIGAAYRTCASTTIEVANEWVQINGSYTAPEDATSIIIYLEGPPPGVNMYVDNVVVTARDWKDEANDSIEQIRKRDASITLQYSNGTAIEGATVDINQVRRHFGFGTAIADVLSTNTHYQNFFKNNFEWAVGENEVKWYANEGTQGNEDYQAFDNMLDFCQAEDIKMRGHTIFWAVQQFVQQWIQGLQHATFPASSELLTAVENRITNVVSRYKGKIFQWDVNNEMLHGSFFEDRLGQDIRPWMFNRAKELDPSTLTFVNDYNIITWTPGEVADYKSQITSLINAGAAIDGIGVQGHFGNGVDPLSVKLQLDSLATLGLPIVISEYDSDTADVQARADDLEALYRIGFAHSSVEGILMWGFWEGRHWKENAHIVDLDWTVNAAGLRYQSLMEEWKTNILGLSTDINGAISFRGFHGKYDITVTFPDNSVETHQIYLNPGSGLESFTIEKREGQSSSPSKSPTEAPTSSTTPAPTPNPTPSPTPAPSTSPTIQRQYRELLLKEMKITKLYAGFTFDIESE